MNINNKKTETRASERENKMRNETVAIREETDMIISLTSNVDLPVRSGIVLPQRQTCVPPASSLHLFHALPASLLG